MLSTIRASATFTEELDNMLFLSIYSEKEEYEKRAKEIRSRLPVPYGSIPKRKCCSTARRRKSQQQQPQQTDTLDAKKNDAVNSNTKSPCPATDIQTTTTTTMATTMKPSLLTTIISYLFPSYSKPEPSKCVGFLPRTQVTVNVATSPLEVLAPAGKSMSEGSNDDCTVLSTSSSSTSSLSSISTLDDVADASSMTALSDILCDYYVQTHCSDKEVPLETFGVFEASTLDDCDASWFNTGQDSETKDWRRIDLDDHHHKNIDNNHAPPPPTPTPPSLVNTPIVEPEIMIENTVNLSEWRHARDIRDNSAHYRMIVAEINMMRANKIICPLRQRMYLPKRTDEFESRPSPLKQQVLAY